VKLLGEDPETGLPVTLREGRFGPFLQLGEAAEKGEKPKRSSLPPGVAPDSIDLDRALKLLALPRPVATHPESGEPILVGIGRYGPYVQHGRTFANLDKGDDVLEIGANRAIDLIVAKESGAAFRGGQRDPGRELGDEPGTGNKVLVKAGRFGPYVTDGEVNATLPRAMSPDAVTLDEAIGLLNARRAAGPSKKSRRRGRASSTKSAGAKKSAAKGSAKTTAAKKSSGKRSAGKKVAASGTT
jgi:DNA topoisomerase I